MVVSSLLGKMIQFDSDFSDGLVQPPTRFVAAIFSCLSKVNFLEILAMDVDHRTGTHKMTLVELPPKVQCWTTATLPVTVAIEHNQLVLSNIFLFSPLLEEMIQFAKYFSIGLKPPTRYFLKREPFSQMVRV